VARLGAAAYGHVGDEPELPAAVAGDTNSAG
jgi:hypothetical protein